MILPNYTFQIVSYLVFIALDAKVQRCLRTEMNSLITYTSQLYQARAQFEQPYIKKVDKRSEQNRRRVS